MAGARRALLRTTYTAAHSAELGRHAKDIGADGILSTPPPYAAPTSREIVAFYQTISDRVELPLMVYNWARGVVVEITADTALELTKIDHVVAIKDSTANRMQALATLEKVVDRIRVFGGFINQLGSPCCAGSGDGAVDGGGLGAAAAARWRRRQHRRRRARRAIRGGLLRGVLARRRRRGGGGRRPVAWR